MSLGQLSNLKEMDLNSNLIKGQIPSIVGSLAGLLSLDLCEYQRAEIEIM
jgi:hypothetical protein